MGKQRTTGVTFRIDRDQIRDNSDGSIDVPGQLTRTGVFPYKRGDDTVRELRSDAEVFSDEALDSLRNVLVTVDHPSEFLTTDNWREHSIGHVSHVASSPPYVTGRLRIYDKNAIHSVRGGYLSEVSCGYECLTEPTETADADVEQVRIAYNHVALGPSGWSRLGTQLRLDSNDNEVVERFDTPKGTNMEDIKEALGPVLDAIQGLSEKVDALEAKATVEPEQTEDSPVQKFETLPDTEKVDALVRKQVDSVLGAELQARDAYEEVFGWRKDSATGQWVRSDLYHVDPVLCGRRLCLDVLQTVDPERTIDDNDDLAPLVREASLLAKKVRQDRLADSSTVSSIRQQLEGVPAHILQTSKKSPIDNFFSESPKEL